MYFDKDHFRKRGTFGSVTPVGIITNYRRTPGKKTRRKGGGKYTLPGLHGGDSVLAKSCYMGGNAEPLSKLSCADLTSLEMWKEEEENFYATLSDDFSTFSCKSGDDSALSEDLRMSEEIYGGSFTTVANDDFEFHDTRPCGGEVKMKPALVSPATPPSRKTSFRGNIFTKVDLPKVPQDQAEDLFNFKGNQDNADEECKDLNLFTMTPTTDLWPDNGNPEQTSDLKLSPKPFGTFLRHQKSTSYSMNDLDLIHQKGSRSEHEESTFLLPVKSESTMSLYRLNIDQELDPLALTPSRSENNVNGDSGFGSGAQSTNPVWSGFLCRKPSDPFWNIRKPTTAVATAPNKNYSAILHPRMRKIPWISAWKKLDENSIHNQGRKEQSKDNHSILGWKENLMYESNPAPKKSIIDEELPDINSPVYIADYNLNIFAKESGVLIENAYGKIVRDDCGVQVNFYGKNAQCDDRHMTGSNSSNVFERSVQPTEYSDQKMFVSITPDESPLQHFNDSSPENANVVIKKLALEKLFAEPSNQFKCETRYGIGHYENLFGTKENIFGQCNQYLDNKQIDSDNQKVHQDNSFRSTNLDESKSIYGQLNKPEEQESVSKKKDGKSPTKSKELRRRESDNRGCVLRRREGRTRSDPRSNFLMRDPNSSLHFSALTSDLCETSSDQKIEIEMQNVNFTCNLNSNRFPKLDPSGLRCNGVPCKDAPTEERRLDKNLNIFRSSLLPLDNESANKVEKRDSRSKSRPSLEVKVPVEVVSSVWPREGSFKSKLPTPVQRRESGRDQKPSGLPVRLEKIEKKFHHHVEDSKPADFLKDGRKATDNRNEGLWVNAIPFSNNNRQNENSPRKDFRKDRALHRSPRKSHLPRRESGENKGNVRIKRKVSVNRPKMDSGKTDQSENQKWAKEIAIRANGEGKRHDAHLDDFVKYRDKCEDNFSHIQNLNRERSAERESSRLDPSGKMNGNITQNGEKYHEEGKLHNTQPSYNENCQEKRLAITDFL